MSDSVQPHRQQPTSLLRPWDSPSKNTGVGCHFLLQCSKVTQSYLTRSDPMDCSPPGSTAHGIFQARVLEWGEEWGATAFSACSHYYHTKKSLTEALQWRQIKLLSNSASLPYCHITVSSAQYQMTQKAYY